MKIPQISNMTSKTMPETLTGAELDIIAQALQVVLANRRTASERRTFQLETLAKVQRLARVTE